MMAIFATKQPNGPAPSPAQTTRPKLHMMIEHLDQAQMHLNAAMDVCSSVILDLEKGAAFVKNYRDSLIKAVEDTGGDVAGSIEHQIREFVPKNYRPPEPAADAGTRES